MVDSASIEVNRRKRRAKSDRLDAVKLVSMLMRWHNGEKKVWSVVHPPSAEDEDHRQLHRELIALKKPTEACQMLAEFDRRYPKAVASVKSRAATARNQAKCS